MAGSGAGKSSTPVEALTHADARANIPTGELADFIAEEETTPAGVRYPRDPSLDPQLVWRGKDEQDSEDLVVPAVPIYIQEKIDPRIIVENLRRTAASAAEEPELALFDDFDGPEIADFSAKVDFYKHEANWSNRMILGDSLVAMTSLAEKERLRGKVQMVYLDPPYGIKFGSNWQVSTRKRDVRDGRTEDTSRQPEQIRAFRDTWKLGIHSYLSYLRDRLVVARELLADSGSVFVQIGDENVHLVRALLDETFGAENWISQLTVQKTASQDESLINNSADYILWYARSREHVKYRPLYAAKETSAGGPYSRLLLHGGEVKSAVKATEQELIQGRIFRISDLTSSGHGGNKPYSFEFAGRTYRPTAQRHWSTHPEGMARLAAAGRIYAGGATISFIRFIEVFSPGSAA